MRKDTGTREEQVADRQAKLDALHEKLTDAVEALVTGEDWRRAMEFAAKFRRYSFGNVLLLWQQGQAAYEAGLLPAPYPEYVAGYKAWQSLGRQVRAGSRGFQILAPHTARVAIAADGSYRRLDRGENPAPGETVSTRVTGVRPTTVFPLEYTDGQPVPERPAPQLLQGEAPPGLWDGLAAQIGERGFTLAEAPDAAAIGGANGVTRFTTKEVLIRADMDPLARAKTACHELGHVAAGHASDDPDVPAHRGLVEVEAESIALLVLSAHNVDTTAYTVPYVSTWASRVEGVDPVTAVQQTAARVRTIALQILDRLDTQKVPDGDPPGLDRVAPKQAAPMPDGGLAHPELDGRHHARPTSVALTDGT